MLKENDTSTNVTLDDIPDISSERAELTQERIEIFGEQNFSLLILIFFLTLKRIFSSIYYTHHSNTGYIQLLSAQRIQRKSITYT